MNLSIAELNHIESLISDNEREGVYYGNREQYWKRSERIKEALAKCRASIHKKQEANRQVHKMMELVR